MKWAGQMVGMKEDIYITENKDTETRRLQRTRKTTAKMGGLSEERLGKVRGRKMKRKNQQQRAMEYNNHSSRSEK